MPAQKKWSAWIHRLWRSFGFIFKKLFYLFGFDGSLLLRESFLLFMIWQQTLLSNEKSHLPNHTHSSWVDMYNTDSTIHLPQAGETAKTFQVFICLLRKQQCYGGRVRRNTTSSAETCVLSVFVCGWRNRRQKRERKQGKEKEEENRRTGMERIQEDKEGERH